MPEVTRIEKEDRGEITVVTFNSPSLTDEQNVQMVGADLFKLVDELGRRKLLLKLTGKRTSSAMGGKFATLAEKLSAHQGKIVLVALHKERAESLKKTHSSMLLFADNEAEGLALLA